MDNTAALAILAGVFGAIVGSFLNVVIYRLPRGESIVTPGSHCPVCDTPIKPFDNVPVLGWLWLRGRCRTCRVAIAPRYPLVEAGTAALCVAVILTRWPTVQVLLGLALVLVLVPTAMIDLDHHIIPNRITAPSAVAAIAIGAIFGWSSEPERLIAGVAAGGFLLLAALVSPRGMGVGDVKLAAVMGLLLGREVAPALFAALIAGVLVGLVVIARTPSGERRGAGIPFGPLLAFGGLVGLFAGHAIVGAYLHQLH
jgi:leader peptidase (prepilin peptidase)/N-methyltransferase